MSLSEKELKQARIASREIAYFKQRKQHWLVSAIWVFYALIQITTHHYSSALNWWWAGLLVLFLGAGLYRWEENRGLKERYSGNVELLRVLGEREPNLVDIVGDPLDYKPLLAAWSRRLNERALLWRLDHFLSGKGWPTN
jgi:hypothetical protein